MAILILFLVLSFAVMLLNIVDFASLQKYGIPFFQNRVGEDIVNKIVLEIPNSRFDGLHFFTFDNSEAYGKTLE